MGVTKKKTSTSAVDPQTFIIKEMQKKLMTRFFNLGPFWSLFAELFFFTKNMAVTPNFIWATNNIQKTTTATTTTRKTNNDPIPK